MREPMAIRLIAPSAGFLGGLMPGLLAALMLACAVPVQAQQVYDASGRPLGRADGERYYDASGRPIGRADGLRRMQLIAYFFFFM